MPIIACVITADRDHENTESYRIYQVEAPGVEPIQVITSKDNIYVTGDVVAVALRGTILTDGTVIQRLKVAGEPSFGMIIGKSAAVIGSDLTAAFGANEPREKNGWVYFIPLANCIAGHIYRLNSRNLVIGVFDGVDAFVGFRRKFGTFLCSEHHYDIGPPYGTAKPYEVVGVVPDGVPLSSSIPLVCAKTQRPIVWDQDYTHPSISKVGAYVYVDTKQHIPPQSQPILSPNLALCDILHPLEEAERIRLAEAFKEV